jgi:SAM-dependent methyltransferase
MGDVSMGGRYVQYGCGLCAPAGWENFDASPTLRFERVPIVGRLYNKNAHRFPANARYGDIVRGLPVEPESCDGIYCSHVLEHLSLEDAGRALTHTHRYLRKGGRFRLVVPDLQRLAGDYLASTSSDAAHRFMESSYLGRKRRPRGLAAFVQDWMGNSVHLWMWDERAMTETLREHGFTAIRRCSLGDSADPRFKDVEDAERFEGCLAIECRK